MVICLERGADLHVAQMMPMPLTVSFLLKSRLVFCFWYWLTQVVPEKGPLNVCVILNGTTHHHASNIELQPRDCSYKLIKHRQSIINRTSDLEAQVCCQKVLKAARKRCVLRCHQIELNESYEWTESGREFQTVGGSCKRTVRTNYQISARTCKSLEDEENLEKPQNTRRTVRNKKSRRQQRLR